MKTTVTVTIDESEIVVTGSMTQISELCHVLAANKVKHSYRIARGGIVFPKKCAYDVLYEMSCLYDFRIH